MGDHWPQLVTFLFTFYVVAIMWAAHNRILNVDPCLRRAPLLAQHHLAGRNRPAAVAHGHAGQRRRRRIRGGLRSTGGLLAVISGLGALMGAHIRRHPELAGGGRTTRSRDLATRWRGPAFTVLLPA